MTDWNRTKGGASVASLGLVWVCSAIVFATIGWFRLIDGDEGYYLSAARAVSSGQSPYADFFYPQSVLMPYLYGAWMDIVGVGWHAGRALSWLAAATTAVVVYLYARLKFESERAGMFAWALFLLNGMAIGWLTAAKTYAATTLMLVTCVALLDTGKRSAVRVGAAGLALGIACSLRSLFLAYGAVMLVHLLARENGRCRYRRAAVFAGGMGLGLLPNLAAFVRTPDLFVFNNFGYHALRSNAGLVGNLPQKFLTLLQWVLPLRDEGAASLQTLLLLVLCVAAARRRPWPFNLVTGAWGIVINQLPTPAHTQYNVCLLPLMAIAAVEGLQALRSAGGRLSKIVAVGLGLYPLAFAFEVLRYTSTGWLVPGVSSHAGAINWRITTVTQIGALAERHHGSVQERPSLSWWPGYFIETHLRPMPGTENQFGREIGMKLTPERRRQVRIADDEQIQSWVRERIPRTLIVGNWLSNSEKLAIESVARESGYRVVATVADTRVYVGTPLSKP